MGQVPGITAHGQKRVHFLFFFPLSLANQIRALVRGKRWTVGLPEEETG
jgi:hypothetical protein